MALTNDLCEVHKRRSGIPLRNNSKRCTYGSECSEYKKQTNTIHFKCERRDVARALNYFKQTYPYKMTALQPEKNLGYNCFFIYIVGSSGSILDPSMLQVHHVKMQALTTDHLIPKRCGEIYLDHLQYDFPQYEGGESGPITFRQYLANMTCKMGKCAGDQIFHAISCDNNPTNLHLMYFPHRKLESTQVLNGISCIIYEELLTNPNDLITRSSIERSTMGKWDKDKCTSPNPNELHN